MLQKHLFWGINISKETQSKNELQFRHFSERLPSDTK